MSRNVKKNMGVDSWDYKKWLTRIVIEEYNFRIVNRRC